MNRRLKSTLTIIVAATVVALAVRVFVLENYRVASDSMAPNLLIGDLVLVSKAHYSLKIPGSPVSIFSFREPKRGDVVAFSVPEQGGYTYIKRIVAIGGDKLEIKDGRIYINDQPASYKSPAGQAASSKKVIETIESAEHVIQRSHLMDSRYGPVDIPKKHFFALGDNRPISIDSRTWGPIPYTYLKGRPCLVWLSVKPGGGVRKGRIGQGIH